MRSALAAAALATFCTTGAHAATIAYWNFESGGTDPYSAKVDNTDSADAAIASAGSSLNANDSRTYTTADGTTFTLGTRISLAPAITTGSPNGTFTLSLDLTGWTDITITMDTVTRSGANTGPDTLRLVSYAIGGGSAVTIDDDELLTYATANGRFDNGLEDPAKVAAYDLSALDAIEGQDDVTFTFNFLDLITPATAGSPRAHIDNVEVTGTIPEPASLALLGAGALCVLPQRRR